jgi:hypothetical protein
MHPIRAGHTSPQHSPIELDRADAMKRVLALLALTAAIPTIGAQSPLRVPGKAVLAGPKAAAFETAFRLHAFPSTATSAVRLAPLSRSAAAMPANDGIQEKRVRVGTRRDLATEAAVIDNNLSAPQWVPVPGGGHVARLAVSSPEAASLRLGLVVRALPEGSELRFAGSAGDERVAGPVAGSEAVALTRRHGIFWTPLTAGETQTVEVWLPASADPAAARFSAETASHLVAGPGSMFKATGLGASQQCNEDVACVAPANPALARAARSVAKLVFTENGVTYLCSGTLINDGDRDSQVPYLYTAAHCIGSQAAAASLNTFWFFDAAACGGKSAADYRQLSGGATLLYANSTTDAALVRLAERAPEGAWFSGWDASPLASGTPVLSLHHPAGDLKKLTLGNSLGVTPAAGGASYSTAAWLNGSTEGGSSGAGLFTLESGEYLLRGGLKGGSASCASTGKLTDPSNRDYYSQLEVEAATLRTWLAVAAAPLEDYTDMWWNPAEPGWGVSIIQRASNRVFVAWYTYDASERPTWLVIPDGKWRNAVSLEGTLYRASGNAYERPYDPGRFAVVAAGTGRIDFGSGDDATLTFSVDGRTIVKPLRRQAF